MDHTAGAQRIREGVVCRLLTSDQIVPDRSLPATAIPLCCSIKLHRERMHCNARGAGAQHSARADRCIKQSMVVHCIGKHDGLQCIALGTQESLDRSVT